MRDFGRYVVEQLKPKGAGLNVPNWLIWVIVIGGIGLLLYYVWPDIFPAAQTVGQGAANVAETVNMG